MRNLLAVIAVLLSSNLTYGEGQTIEINPPAEGSVTQAQGLEAFARIYEVTSHPRCSNCHVGASNRPMWSGPSYGKTRRHGMNINAGESRIGAEFIPCATCHSTSVSGQPNNIAHSAPRVGIDWRLAPVEAEWFGKSAAEICAQLRDPERNGDRTIAEIASHLDHDLILHWAWNPGGNREAAPYSLQEHVNDVLAWGAAGTPCPSE